MFKTVNEESFRKTSTQMPRLLEGDDRNKFIAAVKSPLARDLLNYDVQ